jgi:hypothetical protein
MAAEVIMIDCRRENPVRKVSNKCFRTLHILRSGDSIRVFDEPSLVGK